MDLKLRICFRKKKNPGGTFSQFYLLILGTRGVLMIYMRPTADGSIIPWPSPSWASSAERCFTYTPLQYVSQRRPPTVLRALYLITPSVGSAVWLGLVWLSGASTNVNAAATACRPETAPRFTIRLQSDQHFSMQAPMALTRRVHVRFIF